MQMVPPPHVLVHPAERLSLGFLLSYVRWVISRFAAEQAPLLNTRGLSRRLGRLSARFDRLIVRFRAGTLRPPRAARERTPSARQFIPTPPPKHVRLPARFGWLLCAMKWRAAFATNCLQQLLDDPEMQALIQAAPDDARRVLLPYCHLLGVKPPPILARPRRPRTRRSAAPAAATEPADTPPNLSPEMRAALLRFPRLGATRVPRLTDRVRPSRSKKHW